jgi:hypothetical protein
MELEGTLPFSKEPTTDPYPESYNSPLYFYKREGDSKSIHNFS